MKTSELNGKQEMEASNAVNCQHARFKIRLISGILPIILQFFILFIVGFFIKVTAQPVNYVNEAAKMNQHSNILVADFVNINAKAERLPSYINSAYKETKPLITADGKTLYFGRQNHPQNTGGINDREDIWFSNLDEGTGQWGQPERMGNPINNSYPNFVSCVSKGGDSILVGNVYSKNGKKMKAGLSCCIRKIGVWWTPRQVKIEEDYNLSSRVSYFMDRNGRVLLSSVERDDSHGERDLYISFFMNYKASKPLNLGDVINTKMDESSPFLASDYKSLYFTSKGHNGYGGYDIFVSFRLDDTWTNWSTPVNMGPAINSELDEQYINFTFNDQYAYFTKETSEQDVDIYRIPLAELFKIDMDEKQDSTQQYAKGNELENNNRKSYKHSTGDNDSFDFDYEVVSNAIRLGAYNTNSIN